MLAVRQQQENMFSTTSNATSASMATGQRHPYEPHINGAGPPFLPSTSTRSNVELPRPHESVNIHYTTSPTTMEPYRISSRSDFRHFAVSSRHPSSTGPLASNDIRPCGPSLPSVKDILTSSNPPNLESSPDAWTARPPPSCSESSVTQQYTVPVLVPPVSNVAQPTSTLPRSRQFSRPQGPPFRGSWHPPMALYPPTEASGRQASSSDWRSDSAIPVDQTSSEKRPPQLLPISPYGLYPENREYADHHRPDQSRRLSIAYPSNGIPSPHSTGPHDDSSYAGSNVAYDRVHPPMDLSAIPENQRRYVGVKDIPGEGSFHVYEGGYRIPTHVDGEQVNPAWGLTKANKPRKRLALACLDCREKKIKCEPGVSSCVQCEKAKRVCRRAPNQMNNSDGNGPISAWSNGHVDLSSYQPMSETSPQATHHDVEADVSHKRRSREQPFSGQTLSKKQRSISPSPILTSTTIPIAQLDPEHARKYTAGSEPSAPSTQGQTSGPQRLPDTRELRLDQDPYVLDRALTLHLVEQYFLHVNAAVYNLFPQHTFMHWLTVCMDKTAEENLVLYALLAVASLFTEPSLSDFGRSCADLVTQAILKRFGQCSLFDVQARLLMSLYNCSRGSYGVSYDYCGSAIRAAMSVRLKLNLEAGCLDVRDMQCHGARAMLHLTREQYTECRRRTFWACFLMDRFADGTHCAIDVQNVLLRLPCANDLYEQSRPSDAPFFHAGVSEIASDANMRTRLSPISWLILVGTSWGHVLNFLNRAPHDASEGYRSAYESCRTHVTEQLQCIIKYLPEHLQFSQANVNRSIREGYAGTLITLHATHHYTFIKLNRYVRHKLVMDTVSHNIRTAHYHAHALLAVTTALCNAPREYMGPYGRYVDFTFSTPVPSGMIMSAIDVVSAGGLENSLVTSIDAIHSGVQTLVEQGRFWKRAQDQHKECEKRYYQLQCIVTHPFKAKGGCWLGREWGTVDPMENDFGLEDDCIYGITESEGKPNAIYFEALKDTRYDRAFLRDVLRHP